MFAASNKLFVSEALRAFSARIFLSLEGSIHFWQTKYSKPFWIKPVQVSRCNGFPDDSAVALSVTPVPTITARLRLIRAFLSRPKSWVAHLSGSLEASFSSIAGGGTMMDMSPTVASLNNSILSNIYHHKC